jgi:hypothetical protein
MTPFEEAVIKAQDLAAGIALSSLVMELINEGNEHQAVYRDRTKTKEQRATALKESRRINTTLSVVAMTQSVIGIGA